MQALEEPEGERAGRARALQLFGVMAATGAAGGHVVTSGVFTQEAAALRAVATFT